MQPSRPMDGMIRPSFDTQVNVVFANIRESYNQFEAWGGGGQQTEWTAPVEAGLDLSPWR